MASKDKKIEIKPTEVDYFSQNIIVDFSFKTTWVSVTVDKFTNYISCKDDFFKLHYTIFSTIVSDLNNTCRKNIKVTFRHSHELRGDDYIKALEILKALLKKQNPALTEKNIKDTINQNIMGEQLYQIGYNSVRVIGYFKNNIFKILFFDYHHLISPDIHYNTPDYSCYKFCVYSEGKSQNG